MFKCNECPRKDARIQTLLLELSSQRELLNAAAAKEREMLIGELSAMRKEANAERAAWAKERESLLTRIQAWSPNPDAAQEAPSSQDEAERLTVDGVHTTEELSDLGLIVNTDGGYIDTTLSPPVLYETVEDCLEVRKFLRKNKLPAGVHPGLLTEGGIGEIIELARQAAKNGSAGEETT